MESSISFPKKEHLCGEIRVNHLFINGKAFIVYPLRVVYLVGENKEAIPVKVLVSVPKKRFKRAVKRNRLKRLMRESYRLNRSPLIEKCIEKNINIQIAFNYLSDDEMDFNMIQSKMIVALQKIAGNLDK